MTYVCREDIKLIRGLLLVLLKASAPAKICHSRLDRWDRPQLTSPPNGQALVPVAVYLEAYWSAPSAMPK